MYKSQTADVAAAEIPMIWEKDVPYLIRVGKPGIWIEICNDDDHKHIFAKCIMQ
jgi:hypothetical protein